MRDVLSKSAASLLLLSALSLGACGGAQGPDSQAVSNYLERKGWGGSAPPLDGEPAKVRHFANRLSITVERAVNLPDMDSGPGESDPYVILELNGERKRTSTIQGEANPIWGDTFIFDAPAQAVLSIKVMDADSLSSDEVIGIEDVVLPELEIGESKELELPIRKGEGGTLWLTVSGMARQ